LAASLSVLAASTTVERGGKSTIGSPFSSLGPPAGALEAAKIRYWLGGRPVPEQHVTALRVWTSASKTFSWRSAPFRTHAVSPAPLVPAVAAPLAAAVAAATTTGTARSQLGFWVHEAGCCVAHRPHGQGGTSLDGVFARDTLTEPSAGRARSTDFGMRWSRSNAGGQTLPSTLRQHRAHSTHPLCCTR
jgi:hypothetical protein